MERTIDISKLNSVRSNYSVTITQHEYDKLIASNYQLVVENASLRVKLRLYESNWLLRLITKLM